jgi:unsaturated rhamnogalacturonyl hydrolase
MKNLLKLTSIAAITVMPFMGRAQTVTLDYYFNHEVDKTGARFHYMWEEKDLNGYSNWGDAFVKEGAKIKSLETAPTVDNLKGTDIYIIVDPDTKKESPNPNYIMPADVEQIEKFVKAGGVLVMMANDSANVELPHFNTLAAKFGMHFTDELHNHVTGSIEPGTMMVEGNPLFKTAKKIYMKDVCSIALSGPAKPLLEHEGVTIIATAKYGKGTVFAVGDPWLYNEYTNGHLPADGHYDNDKAITDVTQWLLKQAVKK